MKTPLASIFLLTALAAAALPPDFQEYQLVTTCNIFNSKRTAPPPPKRVTEMPPPKPKPKTLTLVGVLLEDKQTGATFATNDGLIKLATDDAYSQLKLIAITSKSVTLQQEKESILLPVGDALVEGEDKVWRKTDVDRPTISGKENEAIEKKRADQALDDEKKAQNAADVLKRLMERRKRQLGK